MVGGRGPPIQPRNDDGNPKDPPPPNDDDDASHATASTYGAPHTYCMICYSDELPRHRAILPCGHDDACGPCHLRLRHLHSDRRCPVCKADNDKIIVDADPPPDLDMDEPLDPESKTHKPFDSYQMWGDDLGAGYTHAERVGMFFPTEYYQREIVSIFGLGCGVPNCGFENDADGTFVDESTYDKNKPNAKQKREVKRVSGMKALEQHLRGKHGMTLCTLCVENKRDFVSQLPRFTPSGLKKHLSKGDGDGSGFRGHPLCEFCRPRRFYDLSKLHEHLNKDHYKCHVCDKQGRQNQFLKNYDQLARHFDREHFLCHDPQCLAARFVVFENEIDLRGHEASIHGGAHAQGGGSTKINLEFRVRRSGYDGSGYEDQQVPSQEDFQYGLDGEAFVPEALPTGGGGNGGENTQRQENEPEISNAFHAERTAALREEAAAIRAVGQAREQVEAFPALGADADGNGGSMVGWTGDGRAKLTRAGKGPSTSKTTENFPALQSTGQKNNVAARARKGASGSLAAMGAAASAPAAPPGSYATSAVTSSAPSADHASGSFFTAPTATANRKANLSSDNFPSLGGPSSSTAPRPVASSFGPKATAKKPANRKVNLGANNFPSLGAPSAPPPSSNIARGRKGKAKPTAPTYTAAAELAKKLRQQKRDSANSLADLEDEEDFPPPPAASSTKKPAAKPGPKPPSEATLANVMQFPPPASSSLEQGRATVDSLKSALGSAKYKRLKNVTKEFAAGNVDPEKYVDCAAEIFDGGIGDPAFWSYVPGLIGSCPDKETSKKAERYLESLGAASSNGGGAVSASSGYASAAATLGIASGTSYRSSTAAMSGYANQKIHAPYNAAAAVPRKGPSAISTGASRATYSVPHVGGGKKKGGSWGGGGGKKISAKASATSVVSAAALEQTQVGTATRGMAQDRAEERRQKQLESQAAQGGAGGGGKPSKKNKQKAKNDELRSLAFGGN